MLCFLFAALLLVLSFLTLLLNTGLVVLMHRYFPASLESLKERTQEKKIRRLIQPLGVALVIISGILVTLYIVSQYTAVWGWLGAFLILVIGNDIITLTMTDPEEQDYIRGGFLSLLIMWGIVVLAILVLICPKP